MCIAGGGPLIQGLHKLPLFISVHVEALIVFTIVVRFAGIQMWLMTIALI